MWWLAQRQRVIKFSHATLMYTASPVGVWNEILRLFCWCQDYGTAVEGVSHMFVMDPTASQL